MSIKESWDHVRTSAISNCFGKCGFLLKALGYTSDGVANDGKSDKIAFQTYKLVRTRYIRIMKL